MQITNELNSEQRLLDRELAGQLKHSFSVYAEMEEAGFSVEFFDTKSFGGLSVVPSTQRVRVKINTSLMDSLNYRRVVSKKISNSFADRLDNPNFLAGNKQSTRFRKPKTWGKK
ncbi:hypothetical protein pEaSNUABM56_00038 [Erwinia phage pEa_SNUABM_56]|uniref:Uncharacterized protein n=1 Tax=Erwinia phage pEp_SNUABM_01 TaxID=2601643 RepID=A0A5J6DAJ9_9CAUD|nr:hypothetical protein HWC63_gp012 [Erwinia phage pEp_SNUABM_01]QEQ94838.1 hypothetical protein pEpSNUABM01_012 [Erwinia phage pEp_SNUABM_01]UYL85083.1 hypothetical protein pEaSNUABM56_00038 [Erwinia phage pEa_SNUABM_56]